MVIGLVLGRPDLLRDRQPPFVGVAENRIYIENNATELEDPVADDLSNPKLCLPHNAGSLETF
jgi:hypothetical protein